MNDPTEEVLQIYGIVTAEFSQKDDGGLSFLYWYWMVELIKKTSGSEVCEVVSYR